MNEEPSAPEAQAQMRRPDGAGIYGLIVTASVLATAGSSLPTVGLVVAVVGTLVVYWLAEQYAEYYALLSRGHAPSGDRAKQQLRSRWQLITASFIPLVGVLLARLVGATPFVSSLVGLVVVMALLMLYGWLAGRAAGLGGSGQVLLTLAAGSLGALMIALKISLGAIH